MLTYKYPFSIMKLNRNIIICTNNFFFFYWLKASTFEVISLKVISRFILWGGRVRHWKPGWSVVTHLRASDASWYLISEYVSDCGQPKSQTRSLKKLPIIIKFCIKYESKQFLELTIKQIEYYVHFLHVTCVLSLQLSIQYLCFSPEVGKCPMLS